MEKKTASRMIDLVLSIEPPLGELASVINTLPDGEEKKAFIKGVGNILKAINFDFVFKIIKQFPELDPDKDADWRKSQ